MRGVILTAGLGTRLRPLTDVRAKPAMPVGGEPLIRRIIRGLVRRGVRDLVLNLHHLPATITRVLGDGADLGARVRYSWEGPRILGSAGGPRLAWPLAGADPLLIVNGDTLTDVDVSALEAAHRASGALATLALVRNREFDRYGGVRIEGDRVTGFVPRGPQAAGSYHFIGVQIAHAAAFDGVAPGDAANSIGGVYDALMASRPGAVRAFVCDAPFWDVGTVADYWRTHWAWQPPSPEASSGTEVGKTGGDGGSMAESARVTRSILWDDVEVEADAVIDECILTDRVRIPRGATYSRAIVLRRGDAQDVIPLAIP